MAEGTLNSYNPIEPRFTTLKAQLYNLHHFRSQTNPLFLQIVEWEVNLYTMKMIPSQEAVDTHEVSISKVEEAGIHDITVVRDAIRLEKDGFCF